MKSTYLVTAVETRNGTSAKTSKPWRMSTVTLQDMGEKPRCKTPLEMTLDDEDSDLVAKIEGEMIEVSVKSIEAGFKGAIRITGSIHRGKNLPARPAAPLHS